MIDLEPGRSDNARVSVLSWASGLVVPFAVAAVLIPFRSDLSHSAGIIMVLPVVVLAVARGAWVGMLAAFSAAAGFDLFLVAPYLHPGIDRSEDVVAVVALLCVGIIVGLVSSRLSRIDGRSRERLRELTILAVQAETVTQDLAIDDLLATTAENLTDLLGLRSCVWETKDQWDPRLTVGQPTMLDNGQIIGRLGDLPADRGRLPERLELVVASHGVTYGRFVIEPGPGRTSIEERRIAMTFCRLVGSRFASSSPVMQESG